MKLFNSMTMKKEEFVPLTEGKVLMYVCGPTVYNYIHIGNARPFIMFDALRRYFEYRGFDVVFVQNFTDIDDKIINRAKDEGVDAHEIAEKYIGEYLADSRGLGIREATVHPKATECIGDIIGIIEALIEKGFAYQSGGDVYFRAAKFEEYGKLSHQPADDLLAGARIEVTDIKESPVDFALWKSAKPGEPFWESPWGKGRPGWHIECSAMSRRYLGETIDIHCGGVDLIFPHHENEIAQSECATGKPFARYWLHNGHINMGNMKMSKSLGNFFTVRDAAKECGYENIRMFMLMSHYRSPVSYSAEILEQSKTALERLKTARSNYEFTVKNGADGDMTADETRVSVSLSGYRERFIASLDDDFNTADAVSVIFELVREVNAVLASGAPTKAFAQAALSMLDELAGVLGLFYGEDGDAELSREVEALIDARAAARAEKNWAEADRIRDALKDLGIVLEDTAQGVKWKKA